MLDTFNESTVEEAALFWFDDPGYQNRPRFGHRPGEPAAERIVQAFSRPRFPVDHP